MLQTYSESRRSLLCPTLKKVFGYLDCESPEQSFTNLPIERFSLSTASQYYQPLENLVELVEYIKPKLCQKSNQDCNARVETVLQAKSIDIDFDTVSHTLTLTAFWASQTWYPNFSNNFPNDRLEVGILSNEVPQGSEELSLAGFLTVIGEDSKPSPTLFSFPARHHPYSSSFGSSFLLPIGLHPTLQLDISSSTSPTDGRTCSLHLHLTLPRAIFADKYQLSDPLFLASKNLSKIHYTTTPVDLEAPEYAMKIWGSSLLLELAPPPTGREMEWTAQIPLHLRYLLPTTSTSGQSPLELPYPVLFWACTADEGSKFPINPFDKVNIGYDGLFGPNTMFYHLTPEPPAANASDFNANRLTNVISVPVLDLDKSAWVEIGTAAVVAVGFAWVMWCLLGVWRRKGYGIRKELGTKKTQ